MMRPTRNSTAFRWVVDAWLIACVHFDGFRSDPAAYLVASKWWLLRKRVRAHGQFAPLLSRSSKAYALWGLRDQHAGEDNSPRGQLPAIVALVAGPAAAHAALTDTLQNLANEHVPAFVIGADHAGDIAAAAAAIDWQANPWLLPMQAGDRLAPGAAAAYRAAITDASIHLLYADDDLLDRWDRRVEPYFKPDWNSELFRHHDYLTGAAIVRAARSDLQAASAQPDWAHHLVAPAVERGGVHHIRRVLHHRAARAPVPAMAAPAVVGGELPLVSIIVPTRNRLDLLRTCLDGVAATDYPQVDVIVVDNGSDDPDTLAYLAGLDLARARVLRHDGPFNFSAINNRAAAEARGQLLCLLNNDTEVIDPNWLGIMAVQALRGDVGAVGARLLYPDGRIQHAGVVIGVGNAAGHAHRFVHPQEEGYFRRHNLPQFTSAVTAACLVVARERFLAVGGLDERNFAVAFNDVDLCLRLNQRGWQSLYEPRATLIHHESVSRGLDRDPVGAARFAGELAALQRIWKTDEIVDPFHHPQLSRAAERFAVAI